MDDAKLVGIKERWGRFNGKITLQEAEDCVFRAHISFVDMGLAMFKVMNDRLYEAGGYSSFVDWSERRFGISKSSAYRYINAAKVVKALADAGYEIIPESIDPALALAGLKDSQAVAEVWNDAILAEDRPTKQTIQKLVEARSAQALHAASLSDQNPAPSPEPKPKRGPLNPTAPTQDTSSIERIDTSNPELDELAMKPEEERTYMEKAKLSAVTLGAAISELRGVHKDLGEIDITKPGYEVFGERVRGVRDYIHNAISMLRSTVFQGVCSSCEGSGCPVCNSRGWITL